MFPMSLNTALQVASTLAVMNRSSNFNYSMPHDEYLSEWPTKSQLGPNNQAVESNLIQSVPSLVERHFEPVYSPQNASELVMTTTLATTSFPSTTKGTPMGDDLVIDGPGFYEYSDLMRLPDQLAMEQERDEDLEEWQDWSEEESADSVVDYFTSKDERLEPNVVSTKVTSSPTVIPQEVELQNTPTRRSIGSSWNSWFSPKRGRYPPKPLLQKADRRMRKRPKKRPLKRKRRPTPAMIRPKFKRYKANITPYYETTTTSTQSPPVKVFNSYEFSLPNFPSEIIAKIDNSLQGNNYFSPSEEEDQDDPKPSQNVFIFPNKEKNQGHNHQEPASLPTDSFFDRLLDKMEDTIDRVASRSSSSSYHPPAPSYSAPSPIYHAPAPIMYHAPTHAPTTHHHYPVHGKDYDFSPIFLSLIPLLFGLGALLGLNLNNNSNTPTVAAPAAAPNISINSQTSSNSDATSSSSGSNGTSSTSFLPIFVFPNGTLAFPAIIPGLTPIQGLTGITGITLGLGNLFGLIPLPLGRNFPDSEDMDMDLLVERNDELEFTPQYVPMSEVWEEFSFNPIYDLLSVG